MITHIDLSSVLRSSVSESYTSLVTRPTGVAVRNGIEQKLREIGARTTTIIDFSHVKLIDLSCADEIVAKLILQSEDHASQFVFTGLSDMHVEVIDAVLERHNMALFPHEGPESCVGYVAAPLSA